MSENLKALEASIVESVQEVFSTMIMMDVEKASIKSDGSQKVDTNISSMLGLGGDMRGMLSVHFPEKVAIKITESFLGMEVEGLDEDVKDAVGEIANMVAGNIKLFFADNGVQTELAIPTTVIGKSYRTSGLAGAEKSVVPFNCDPGMFLVEMKFLLNKKND